MVECLIRSGLCLVLMSIVICPVRAADIISSEQGFEGAVRVIDQWEDDAWGYVTVTIPYRDIRGQVRKGQGRLYFTRDLLDAKDLPPIYCHAHYEIPQAKAKSFCELGFIVATAHYEGDSWGLPFGDSYNRMKALIQWVRRLSCVDRSRLQIGGDSAGGYMTLAMGAEFFPVAALTPNVPAVNWAYGCNYLRANRQSSGGLLPPGVERPLPVLSLIAPGVDLATDLFGKDLSAEKWYTLSPVSYLDRITAPTLVVCATGDMLCTIEQFTAKQFFTLQGQQFPEDYQRSFKELTLCPQARHRFDEALSNDDLFIHVIPHPEGLREYSRAEAEHPENLVPGKRKIAEIDLPWSKEKQWSLVILDEGSPLPHSGHTRYDWNVKPRSFMAYHRQEDVHRDQLNAAKLQRLMERYAGQLTQVATLADGTPANRLNFAALERLDVLTGLLDYSALGIDHASRLENLYRSCPVQPFGDRLQIQQLRVTRTKILRRFATDSSKKKSS